MPPRLFQVSSIARYPMKESSWSHLLPISFFQRLAATIYALKNNPGYAWENNPGGAHPFPLGTLALLLRAGAKGEMHGGDQVVHRDLLASVGGKNRTDRQRRRVQS